MSENKEKIEECKSLLRQAFELYVTLFESEKDEVADYVEELLRKYS